MITGVHHHPNWGANLDQLPFLMRSWHGPGESGSGQVPILTLCSLWPLHTGSSGGGSFVIWFPPLRASETRMFFPNGHTLLPAISFRNPISGEVGHTCGLLGVSCLHVISPYVLVPPSKPAVLTLLSCSSRKSNTQRQGSVPPQTAIHLTWQEKSPVTWASARV